MGSVTQLTATDTGGGLCQTNGLDLFVGEGQEGLSRYNDFMKRPGLGINDHGYIPEFVSVYKIIMTQGNYGPIE